MTNRGPGTQKKRSAAVSATTIRRMTNKPDRFLSGEISEPFHVVATRILERYGELLGVSANRRDLLVMHLIETWETIEVVTPLLRGIAKASYTDGEFRSALIELNAWAWHLADHAQCLNRRLNGECDAHIARQDAEEVAAQAQRRARPKQAAKQRKRIASRRKHT